MGKILKWLFLGFVGLALLGAVIEANKSPEQKAAEARGRQEAERLEATRKREEAKVGIASLPAFSASDLARAYDENTVAADAMFKGKKFKVRGVVSDINTDIFGNPYLTLRGGVNQFLEPQFSFDKGSAAQLAVLRKGRTVELVCVGRGDIAKTPMSGDCILP